MWFSTFQIPPGMHAMPETKDTRKIRSDDIVLTGLVRWPGERQVAEGRSRIELTPGSCEPNWLHGNASTSKPLRLYFSCSSARALYCAAGR